MTCISSTVLTLITFRQISDNLILVLFSLTIKVVNKLMFFDYSGYLF